MNTKDKENKQNIKKVKAKLTKKEFSRFVVPSLTLARKRLIKDTPVINFNLDDKLKGFGLGKFYLMKTYGCQGNLADSEKMAGILEAMGYQETQDDNVADVIIFNTCAIRENAENRVFGELGRIKNLKTIKKDLLMIICGCMSQEEKVVNMIASKYPQVDIVIGTHNIALLGEYIYEAYTKNSRIIEVFSKEGEIYEEVPMKRASSHRAWVNIMYGCDEFCTYCIVPYTRGKERSRHPQEVIDEVKELVKEGYVDITLLGQNVNAYGKDFVDIKYSFANLLEDLSKTGIPRIRYTTSHPRDLDLETIKVMGKYPNIMPHLHLPVQSGSNTVLKRMNRKYTKEEYLEKVSWLREYVPGISLTTDIIVGFPNESDEDFLETLDLVEKAGFEGAFTFIYSKREGTPAASFPDSISDEVKKERLLQLNEKINEGFLKGNLRFENQILDVLVEGYSEKDPTMLTGYTPHEKLVNFEGTSDLIGKVVKVKIIKAYSWHLRGELV